jgi:molybdate transport system substrate-binding protein
MMFPACGHIGSCHVLLGTKQANGHPTRAAQLLRICSAVMAALVLTLVTADLGRADPTKSKTVTVFAAASLKTVLDAATPDFEKQSGYKLAISYAGSSALARQIEQGAPADVFISADLDWMDYLAKAHLIKTETRIDLLGNRLVLIAPSDQPSPLRIAKDFPLAAAIGTGRLAIADVKSVPAGRYAKAALEHLGVWASVENRLAQTENVRAALALVALGEVRFGIVYATDAKAEPRVTVVDTFPEGTHPPVVYPMAITAGSTNTPAADAFVAFLQTNRSKARFLENGFTVLR